MSYAIGNLTVSTGSILADSSSSGVTISGNILNNGTFTAGSELYTLTGSGKTIGGSSAVSLASASISGTYTNNGTFGVTGRPDGAGTLTKAGTGTLNLGGSTSISMIVATAVGNTVNYNGAGAQTPVAGPYYNLS